MNRDNKFNGIIIAILYFILGSVFLSATEELLKTFNFVLVCICTIIGVLQIIGFFIEKKYYKGVYTDLLIGIVFIWVGLILYVYYGFMINILPILFSLYLFIMSMSLVIKYIELKEYIGFRRLKYLYLALIAVLIGCLLIFNPGSVIFIYLKITGIYLILVSLMCFFDLFKKVTK